MTEMEVAAGTEPVAPGRTGFRRLTVSLGITGGTQSAMYAGIGSVLLPSQLEQIDRAHKVAALGLVAGVSAIFAIVFNPLAAVIPDRVAASSAVGAIIAASIAGPLSDRLNRRKPFVFISSAVARGGCLLPVLSPTFTTIEIFAAFAGIAFGCYLSVDAALVTLVLPRTEDAARDLGVLNIANTAPQVIAPLIAALIIGHLGGYRSLFILGGCCGIAGAFAVMPVRAVR